MTLQDLKGKKIAVLGLGVNNQFLVEYFKEHGIAFEIFKDWKRPDELLGKIDDFDFVFRTPGLPYLSKPIQQAKIKGVVIYSQTKLFFDLCPCPIIGVTGTKGKGTTAALISKILKGKLQASESKVYLGGNIGSDPFEFIDRLTPSDWVVLELSSFQLQDLHKSPHVSVALQITPEHMDYHENFEEYVQAKKNIVLHQRNEDFAILNYDNEVTRGFADFTPAKVFWNSRIRRVSPGCYVESENIFFDDGKRAQPFADVSDVKLIGRFNLENVTAAAAASAAVLGGTDRENFRRSISEFLGLPHRLEFVRETGGVKFFNDSFSTTPEAAMAAIAAFEQPLILIVGGSEKNSDYAHLAESIKAAKVKAIIPIGVTGPKIADLARAAGFAGRIVDKKFSDMGQVVAEANALAAPEDVVLLSPGAASFGMFADYKQRGELFKKFVNSL